MKYILPLIFILFAAWAIPYMAVNLDVLKEGESFNLKQITFIGYVTLVGSSATGLLILAKLHK